MLHAIGLGLGLSALWLLLSGFFEPLLLSLGLISVLLCVYLAHRMDVVDHETMPLHISYGILSYLVWLTIEVAKANWAVTKVILSPKMALDQRFITVPTTQRDDLGRVIYANSITLTPGTITVEIEPGSFLVHALTKDAADMDALADMGARVTAIEGKA